LTSTGKSATVPKCGHTKVWETNRRAHIIPKENNDLSKNGSGGTKNKGAK